MAVYSAGSLLVWREVEGGELSTPRSGLRASVVNNILYVSGGVYDQVQLTSVLLWNQAGQAWQEAGHLAVGRHIHAAVSVPLSLINCN